jgi:hypothetical protein
LLPFSSALKKRHAATLELEDSLQAFAEEVERTDVAWHNVFLNDVPGPGLEAQGCCASA